jgi:hypothetical protein
MASKEKKTAPELVALITNELHYHQFNHIVNVTVSPSQQGPVNWTASYDVEASRSGPWPVYPEVDKLIQLFQEDFDLI